MGTVLGGLLLPKFETFDYGRSMNQGILGGSQLAQGQTALLALQEEKQKQQSMQMVYEAIKHDPALAQQLLGGSVLGSLGQPAPDGAPGGAPMMQQQVMPGQPPGAPQVVPGGQDISQFATQGGPPQSTLASLGPAGQPRMQAPRNPVLEMAQRDPRAAMMLQDQQVKAFTTQLSIREKTAEAFATRLQGVNSQESYEAAVQDLTQWAPQQAARLPRVWSKEAMEPIIGAALSAKDNATFQIAALNEQTDLRKQLFTERQAAAGVPKYTEDSTLNVAIDRRMQQAGIPRGTPPSEAILTQAQQDVETGKIRVSASHGTGQIVKGPTGEYIRVKPGTDQVEVIKGPGGEPLREKPSEAEQRATSFGNRAQAAHENAVALEDKGLTPGIWSKVGEALPFGLGNYLVGEDQQRYRQAVSQFAQALLRKESGAAISPTEYTMTETTYFPQPGNSKKVIEDKRRERERIVKEMQAEGQGTGRTGTQAQPTSQGSTASSQGPATFDRADFLKWRQGAGKSGNPTQADVEAYFQAKGLKRR